VDTCDEKGNFARRFYYFDIARCLDPHADRIDAIVAVPEDRIVRTNFGRTVEVDVSTSELEYDAGLLPASVLLDPVRFMEWQQGYQAHFGLGDTAKTASVNEFATKVWMSFQKFKVPVIELRRETPKEAVCQVFEKVNTGGVSLTVFELMTATYAADDFNLADDWKVRKAGLAEHDVLTGVGGTEFLQAVTLLSSWNRSKAGSGVVSAKRRDVLGLELEDYRACADSVEAGFLRAARLLASVSILDDKNLPYGTQLVPLAAVCGALGLRFEEVAVRRRLQQWYWSGVFGELYGGAGETRFAMDVQDLCTWILDGGPEPRTIRDAEFSPLRLLTLQSRQSAAYKGLLALMVRAGSRDFMNGDAIADTHGFKIPVDIHHVFPRSWCEKAGLPKAHWNSILNKTPLTKRTNILLRGDAPSAYLGRLLAKGSIDRGTLDQVLRSHLLDPSLLRNDEFDAFVCDRAVRLLDAIEAAMEKPVVGRDSEAVVEAFGASVTSKRMVA